MSSFKVFSVYSETWTVPEYAVLKDPVSTELTLMRGEEDEIGLTRNPEILNDEAQDCLKMNLDSVKGEPK